MAGVTTPDIRQSETAECGLAALTMVLRHHGCPVTLEELRRQTGSTRLGVTARQLVALARQHGMEAQAFRKAPQDLPALGFPLLVHSQFIHFQVVEAITDRHVRVNDPAAGPLLLRSEDFAQSFTGIVLRIRPAAGTRPRWRPPGLAARLRRFLAPRWPVAAAALLLSLLGCGAATAAAIALSGTSPPGTDWPAAAVLAAVAATAHAGRHGLLGRLGQGLARSTLDRAAATLLRQPPHWFAHRSPAHVATTLSAGQSWPGRAALLAAVADTALAVVPVAAAVVLAPLAGAVMAAALAAALAAVAMVGRRGAPAARIGDAALVEMPTAEILHAWESWKAGGRDDELLARLAGHHAAALSDHQEAGIVHGQVAALRHGLAALALAAALTLAPSGLAAPLAVLAILAHRPLAALHRTLPDLAILRRLLAVLDDADAPPTTAAPPAREESGLMLDGVVFPPLSKEICLHVRPGQELGLTGPSGSGKSVVAKLACGLLTPRSGQVRLDGVAAGDLPPGAAALVGRHVPLVAGSVAANLRLDRDDLPESQLRRVLALVELSDDLDRRQGLETRVGADGQGLSGGQRRRLGLARALLRQPRLLVLDQCLDAVEAELDRRIRHRLRQDGHVVVTISDQPERLDGCDLRLCLGETP